MGFGRGHIFDSRFYRLMTRWACDIRRRWSNMWRHRVHICQTTRFKRIQFFKKSDSPYRHVLTLNELSWLRRGCRWCSNSCLCGRFRLWLLLHWPFFGANALFKATSFQTILLLDQFFEGSLLLLYTIPFDFRLCDDCLFVRWWRWHSIWMDIDHRDGYAIRWFRLRSGLIHCRYFRTHVSLFTQQNTRNEWLICANATNSRMKFRISTGMRVRENSY